MSKPRLLLISKNFPPTRGGIEKLCHELINGLSASYSCVVIGPTGGEDFVGAHVRYLGCPLRPLPLFFVFSLLQGVRLRAAGEKFEFVVGGSALVAPLARCFGFLFKAKKVLFVHGLDLLFASLLYQRFFVPSVRCFDLLISNSRETTKLAQKRIANSASVSTILPGVANERVEFSCSTSGQRPTLLFVGRLIPRKGVAEFVTNALPDIVKEIPEINFVIIGTEVKSRSSFQPSVLHRIKTAIDQYGLSNNVDILGEVSDETLSHNLQMANLFVFPAISLPGDMEGFGVVNIEAAAYGLPSIAFEQGGIPSAIKHNETGVLIDADDYVAFARACVSGIRNDFKSKAFTACQAWAEELSWESYVRRVDQTLKEL